jgi:hypothetical protein
MSNAGASEEESAADDDDDMQSIESHSHPRLQQPLPNTNNMHRKPLMHSAPSILARMDTLPPPFIKIKPEDTTRLYFANPNGFTLPTHDGQFSEWCLEIQHLEADLIRVSEHNIDTTNTNARRICFESAKETFKKLKLEMASSAISTQSTNEPGVPCFSLKAS